MEEDDTRLIERLSSLLHEICVALKGKPPAGVMYSWHDLPELAQANRKALQNIMQILGPEPPTSCGCCEGCNMEMQLALGELKKVGIEYKRREPARP